MWDLPRPGLEPVSPALAGRLSTTVPPGKPGRDLLTELGVTLFLEGQGNHPHHQMVLTKSKKEQIKSEAKIKALVNPGIWNIEVPGLAKYIQPVIIK